MGVVRDTRCSLAEFTYSKIENAEATEDEIDDADAVESEVEKPKENKTV